MASTVPTNRMNKISVDFYRVSACC